MGPSATMRLDYLSFEITVIPNHRIQRRDSRSYAEDDTPVTLDEFLT